MFLIETYLLIKTQEFPWKSSLQFLRQDATSSEGILSADILSMVGAGLFLNLLSIMIILAEH